MTISTEFFAMKDRSDVDCERQLWKSVAQVRYPLHWSWREGPCVSAFFLACAHSQSDFALVFLVCPILKFVEIKKGRFFKGKKALDIHGIHLI